MTDWTSGYVADIGYTYGYYTELNPQRVKLAFLNQGLVFPEAGAACELGFGQGMSSNLHAAASVTQWHATDFNPAQAGFAQELASASGAQAKLYDQVKWTPKTGQQFKWDTVTRNGVNHDRYKKAQRSPAGVQSQGGA